MNKILLASIAIFLSTQYLSAQSPGPLGFTWGEGRNQRDAVEQIDFSKKYDILSEEDQHHCAREAINYVMGAPDSWKTDYSDYISSGNSIDLARNSARADASMEGRLTAYIYNVNVLGEQMKVCGAFLDDQLYSIHIEISKREKLIHSFTTTYLGIKCDHILSHFVYIL